MSYGEAKDFLAKHTKVVELANSGDARVAVCPEWQGRVMTSTCGDEQGPSFGFINTAFIEHGQSDPKFNNYGAEDRMWLSPEGGPFSLWFKPGDEQVLENWSTPPAMNEGAFDVTVSSDTRCGMERKMAFQNASGTDFSLSVAREVRLLDSAKLESLFGREVAEVLAHAGVKTVAYETVNTITNDGPPMTKGKGLVSIWILGMLRASPETVVLVPYRTGPESERGEVVKSDYFGIVPPDRLKVLPEAILFKADAAYRAKIGTSQRRAKNVLGSIDFTSGTLTIVRFSMPEDPTQHDYMNNMWQVPQPEPYVGDVANAYNDGSAEPGKKGFGAFYEIESLSPAAALATGESLTHTHRTVHIQADMSVLARLAKEILEVDLDVVRREMVE